MSWIVRRLQNAKTRTHGTPAEVPQAVSTVLEELLANELQHPLKPEETRRIVTRLAAAMRETA